MNSSLLSSKKQELEAVIDAPMDGFRLLRTRHRKKEELVIV